MYTIRVIRTERDFFELKEAWTKVLRNSESNIFFLSWEWLYSWWTVYGSFKDSLSIVVAIQDGLIAAIAPLMARKEKYYGFNVQKLMFIGEGNSDRADIIADRNDSKLFDCIVDAVYNELDNWDVLYLREVPSGSPFISALKRANTILNLEDDSVCPFLSITKYNCWDEYNKTLSKKLKRDFNNKRNHIKKLGECNYEHLYMSSGECERYLKLIKTIEVQSSKAFNAVNLVFEPEINYNFQEKVISSSADIYSVKLSMMKIDGKVVSYLYGFIYGNRFYAYNMAYNPDYFKVSPGKLLMHEAVRHAFETQLSEFDWLRGASDFKSKWTKEERSQVHITTFRKTFKNRIIRYIVFRFRPWFKSMKYTFERSAFFQKLLNNSTK